MQQQMVTQARSRQMLLLLLLHPLLWLVVANGSTTCLRKL
jgi:hypothetical protein